MGRKKIIQKKERRRSIIVRNREKSEKKIGRGEVNEENGRKSIGT